VGEKAKNAVSFINYGLIVMTVTHVLTHVFGGVHPAIFSILREEFSLSLQQLGIIAAIPPLLQALVSIPTGLLSDKIGSKRMVLVSLVVALLGALLASQTTNPLTFIVAISIVYLNTTIYHPASYSYTSNLFEGKDRPKALGLHGAGGTLGHAMGPLSVSILIGLLGMEWRQVYLLLGAPLLLGIVMLLFLKDVEGAKREETEPEPEEGDAPSIMSILSRSMVMFLIYSALRMMGGSMISNFIVLYLQDVRHLDIALASFIASGTMLFGFIAAPIGGVHGGEVRREEMDTEHILIWLHPPRHLDIRPQRSDVRNPLHRIRRLQQPRHGGAVIHHGDSLPQRAEGAGIRPVLPPREHHGSRRPGDSGVPRPELRVQHPLLHLPGNIRDSYRNPEILSKSRMTESLPAGSGL
jgi:MFS family permease